MKMLNKLWQLGSIIFAGAGLLILVMVSGSGLSKFSEVLFSVVGVGAGLISPRDVWAQTAVEGKGKVIAVTLEKQEIVLEHGEIKGFMDAMTMGYKVSSPSLLKGLKAGDQVQFTIDTKKSVITKVTKLKN